MIEQLRSSYEVILHSSQYNIGPKAWRSSWNWAEWSTREKKKLSWITLLTLSIRSCGRFTAGCREKEMCEVTVNLTHWPSQSAQFDLETSRRLGHIWRHSLRCSWDIAFTREGLTDNPKHNTSAFPRHEKESSARVSASVSTNRSFWVYLGDEASLKRAIDRAERSHKEREVAPKWL